MRLLLAEDEHSLAKALVKILELNHYAVDAVDNGLDALSYLQSADYDAAILDIMMPGMDGLEVLREIRRSKKDLPIILLTAKSEVEDRVLGLDSGADDYLCKPFASKELLARLRALTRRQGQGADAILQVGNTSLNRASFELSTKYGSIVLPNKEFQMLEMLMMQENILISTETFFEKIWGWDSDSDTNVVWVTLSYLRKKLKEVQSNVEIKSSRNAGYSLEVRS